VFKEMSNLHEHFLADSLSFTLTTRFNSVFFLLSSLRVMWMNVYHAMTTLKSVSASIPFY
jgi:hypothetical protein